MYALRFTRLAVAMRFTFRAVIQLTGEVRVVGVHGHCLSKCLLEVARGTRVRPLMDASGVCLCVKRGELRSLRFHCRYVAARVLALTVTIRHVFRALSCVLLNPECGKLN